MSSRFYRVLGIGYWVLICIACFGQVNQSPKLYTWGESNLVVNTREIDETKIIEIAGTSEAARELMKSLYPDLFREYIDISDLKQHTGFIWTLQSSMGAYALIMTARGNEYEGKGFYLNPTFTWDIVEKNGNKYLIPYK